MDPMEKKKHPNGDLTVDETQFRRLDDSLPRSDASSINANVSMVSLLYLKDRPCVWGPAITMSFRGMSGPLKNMSKTTNSPQEV